MATASFRIGQISGSALLIEQGALYPALFRLVRQGLLKASGAHRRTIAAPSSTNSRPPAASGCAKRRTAGIAWRCDGRGAGGATGGSMNLFALFALWCKFLHRREGDRRNGGGASLAYRAPRRRSRAFGLARPEAERRARVEFGARARSERKAWQPWAGTSGHPVRDCASAWRVLRKSPASRVAAILTLALAIGATRWSLGC